MPVSNSPSPTANFIDAILVVGAGGHGRVVAELVQACGYPRVDFVDDRSSPAIGALSDLATLAPRYVAVAVSIGNLPLRQELLAQLESLSVPLPPLVHPTAHVSPSAELGPGVLVLAGAIVSAGAIVGKGSIISAGAVIDHDAVVGSCSHIDAGAVVAARASVPPLTKIPAGTCVRPGAPITDDGGTT